MLPGVPRPPIFEEARMSRTVRWCAAVALALSAAASAHEKKEPEYNRVPLSKWVERLKSPDAKKRVEAAQAIEKIGPAAKDAVPALIQTLKDNDPDVREGAARALGEIGPGAKDAVPALVDALK